MLHQGRTTLAALVSLAMFGPAMSLAQGAPQAKTMRIMDASGSMWGKVEGEYKIVIAREIIGELMTEWDPDMPLGLSAYSHNNKGNCEEGRLRDTITTETAAEFVLNVGLFRIKGDLEGYRHASIDLVVTAGETATRHIRVERE